MHRTQLRPIRRAAPVNIPDHATHVETGAWLERITARDKTAVVVSGQWPNTRVRVPHAAVTGWARLEPVDWDNTA